MCVQLYFMDVMIRDGELLTQTQYPPVKNIRSFFLAP